MWTLSWGMWDLVPWPGIEPWPPAQSLNLWTTREVPVSGMWRTENLPYLAPDKPQLLTSGKHFQKHWRWALPRINFLGAHSAANRPHTHSRSSPLRDPAPDQVTSVVPRPREQPPVLWLTEFFQGVCVTTILFSCSFPPRPLHFSWWRKHKLGKKENVDSSQPSLAGDKEKYVNGWSFRRIKQFVRCFKCIIHLTNEMQSWAFSFHPSKRKPQLPSRCWSPGRRGAFRMPSFQY